jgi:hypothetical protein
VNLDEIEMTKLRKSHNDAENSRKKRRKKLQRKRKEKLLELTILNDDASLSEEHEALLSLDLPLQFKHAPETSIKNITCHEDELQPHSIEAHRGTHQEELRAFQSYLQSLDPTQKLHPESSLEQLLR